MKSMDYYIKQEIHFSVQRGVLPLNTRTLQGMKPKIHPDNRHTFPWLAQHDKYKGY